MASDDDDPLHLEPVPPWAPLSLSVLTLLGFSASVAVAKQEDPLAIPMFFLNFCSLKMTCDSFMMNREINQLRKSNRKSAAKLVTKALALGERFSLELEKGEDEKPPEHNEV